MRALLFLSLLFFTGGCVEQTGYGDGRLVAIYTDSDFNRAEIALLRTATHTWDAYGARLRLEDEVDGAPSASLYIERSAAEIGSEGCTWPGLDRITIYAHRIWSIDPAFDPDPSLVFRNVATHELGHAMGLEHVAPENALMNARVSSQNEFLTISDHAEFLRVYPPKVAILQQQ